MNKEVPLRAAAAELTLLAAENGAAVTDRPNRFPLLGANASTLYAARSTAETVRALNIAIIVRYLDFVTSDKKLLQRNTRTRYSDEDEHTHITIDRCVHVARCRAMGLIFEETDELLALRGGNQCVGVLCSMMYRTGISSVVQYGTSTV